MVFGIFKKKPDPEYCEYLAEMINILGLARQCVEKLPDGAIWTSPKGLSRQEVIEMINFYMQGFLNEAINEKCPNLVIKKN